MTLSDTRLSLLLAALLLGIAACTAREPPVQEMSDARQAIAAAREAGAATLDNESLRAAEVQLADAEARLQQRLYWDAKRLAQGAKETAIAALLRSRSLRERGAIPAPVATPALRTP